MRTKVLTVLSLLFLTVVAFCPKGVDSADADDLFMISVSLHNRDYLQHVKNTSVSYGHIDNQTAVVLVREKDQSIYQKEGIAYEILGTVTDNWQYVLVSFRDQYQKKKLEHIGRIVTIGENRALIRVKNDWDRFGPKYGIELINAFFIPQVKSIRKLSDVSPSPLLNDIIHQVSPVMIYNYILDLQNFQTRFGYADGCSLAADYLKDQFESWGLDVTEHWFINEGWIEVGYPADPQRNIIATLPGTIYPDEIVAICAHYDSRSDDNWNFAPGADDDASGTAAVLEMARILSQYGSERTLQFICFGGEEQWMIGSYAYVEERKAAGDNFVAVINNDMIAYTADGQFEDIEVDCIPETEWLADEVMALASDFVTYPVSKNVGWENVSDHTPFWENEYPAIELAEDEADDVWGGTNPFYHTTGDVIETLNMEFATQIVKMNAAALASLAGVEVSGAVVVCAEHTMDDDDLGESLGNGNGYVDPGEAIELGLSLNNIGHVDVSGVSATLESEDDHVIIVRNTVEFGDILSGGSATGQNTYSVHVSQDCPNGHQILFSVTIQDDQSRSWGGGFVVEVLQPTFVFQAHSFEEVEGNGNTVINPGETINLFVLIENAGLRGASGITARLETNDSDITIADSEALLPDIDVTGVAENRNDPFTFTVNEEADSHSVTFTMHLTEGQGYYHIDMTVQLIIGQGKILFVVDDEGNDNQNYYMEVFELLGISYDVWDVQGRAKVVSDTLLNYPEVIWFTGPVEKNTLTPEDQSALDTYLNGGGRILLSGNLIGSDIGNTSFYRNFLHGYYISFMTMLHHLNGTLNNPVSGEVDIALASTGNTAQTFAGETDPISPAISVFDYDRDTEEGPGLIRSSGSGALAMENSIYKVVYFSFGVEGIEPLDDRVQVLLDVLTWFKEPGVDKGDVDGNGSTDIIDAVVAVNIVLGMHQPDEGQMARADMNYDGAIDIIDVVKVVNAVLGTSGKASVVHSKDM
ncbi:MAG: M20/M25/M40 family metallo-hydrolase [Gemmatimonadota bacterium]|nr:MAG: M20/M25/M40 family metallo-hydrolase [Gemmatimonadota bacterium]